MAQSPRISFKKPYHRNIAIEAEALRRIDESLPTLPHFCKIVDFDGRELEMTRVDDGILFDAFLHMIDVDWKIKLNCIYQILFAMNSVFEKTGISHNDLHLQNAMVVRDPNITSVTYSDGTMLDTFGYISVIVDFGEAIVPDFEQTISWDCIDIGVFPFEADRFADFRVFTTETASALKEMEKPTTTCDGESGIKQFILAVDALWNSMDEIVCGYFRPGSLFQNLCYYSQSHMDDYSRKRLEYYRENNLSDIFIDNLVAFPRV